MQDSDFDKAIGKRCRLLRERSGYTQKDAAIHVGVSTQQMQKYESGKNRINALVLFKLKRLYDVEWSIFFEDLDTHPFMLADAAKPKIAKDTNYYVEHIHSNQVKRALLGILKELAEQCLANPQNNNPEE